MSELTQRPPEEVAMIRSGVGRHYLDKRLADYLPEAQGVLDFVKATGFKSDLLRGYGAQIHGTGRLPDAMIHMVARSAIGRGINCTLIDLCDLERAMVQERASDEVMHRIERAAVILIPSFVTQGFTTAPFEPRSAFGLERVLTTFLDEGRALILGCTAPLSRWWSDNLCALLADRTLEIHQQ